MRTVYVKRTNKDKFRIVKLTLRNSGNLIRSTTVSKNLTSDQADLLLKTIFKNKE